MCWYLQAWYKSDANIIILSVYKYCKVELAGTKQYNHFSSINLWNYWTSWFYSLDLMHAALKRIRIRPITHAVPVFVVCFCFFQHSYTVIRVVLRPLQSVIQGDPAKRNKSQNNANAMTTGIKHNFKWKRRLHRLIRAGRFRRCCWWHSANRPWPRFRPRGAAGSRSDTRETCRGRHWTTVTRIHLTSSTARRLPAHL